MSKAPAIAMRTPRPMSARSSRGRPARRGAALAGLLAGALAGLLIFAPARWLGQAVAATGRIQLDAAQGTVWRGSARLWLVGGTGSADRAALPKRVHWELTPFWRGLELGLRADCCTPQAMRLALTLSGGSPTLTIHDGSSSWPAEVLQGLGAPWNTLQPAGQLALQTRGLQLRWRQGAVDVTGQATLDLQNISSSLSTLQPMGSYRLTLSEGTRPLVQLTTLQGELVMTGQGQLGPTGFSFRGQAQAAPGRENALANFLNIVGKRDGARSLISLG